MNTHPAIEFLEARISPAAIVNPYTVSYLDENNQVALIRFSKPLFTSVTAANHILTFTDTSGNAIGEHYTGNTTDEMLGEIDLLSNRAAQDMSISVASLPYANVLPLNVGYIAAADFATLSTVHLVTQNIDLGHITIQGNLGGITAGDSFSTPAIQSLNVQSMTTAQESDVLGPITSLHVTGDFATYLNVIGASFGTINHLYIGGSLTANALNAGAAQTITTGASISPGLIQFTGRIVNASIGSMVGGSEAGSGSLIGSGQIGSSIGSLTVKGSITGGSGNDSGEIFANNSIGSLTVKGSVTGSTGVNSGKISTGGSLISPTTFLAYYNKPTSIGKITISGNLQGGTGGSTSGATPVDGETGFINTGTLGSLAIGGQLIGGDQGTTTSTTSGTTSTIPDTGHTASYSGAIVVAKVGPVSIGGIVGGSGSHSGYLGAATSMGKVVISGSVTGGSAGTGTDSTGTAGYSGAIKSPTISSLSISGQLTGGSEGTIAAPFTSPATSPSGTVPDTAHTANVSGVIAANTISSLSIGGGIAGGGGFKSGAIFGVPGSIFGIPIPATNTALGTVTIGGDVTGGAGTNSGFISSIGSSSGVIQSLHIAGNLLGGAGANSGEISVSNTLGTLDIVKSVTGGTANTTGAILVGGSLNNAIVGGDFAASSAINSSSAISESGYLQAGHIGTLKIVGDVTTYANAGTGGISNSGAICSTADIGTLTIEGTVTGVSATDPVVISAAHGVNKTKKPATTDLAIGSVILDHAVSYLDILAGYSPTVGSVLGTPVDGSAQIGLVSCVSSVQASNIVAGCNQGADGYFGNVNGVSDDTAITGGDTNSAIQSKIASIVVTGTFTGDGTSGHTFAFEAQQLTSVTVNNGSVQSPVPSGVGGTLLAVEVTM